MIKIFNDAGIVINLHSEKKPFQANCIDLNDYASKETIMKFINSGDSKQGISWTYEGKEIILKDDTCSVYGNPTVDMNYMVITYSGLQGKFPPPSNTVIYNLDGTIHKILEMPFLLSQNIIKHITFCKEPNPPLRFAKFEGALLFMGFGWHKLENGDNLNKISIQYDREWWESRILNPETGEIGDLINSGRL